MLPSLVIHAIRYETIVDAHNTVYAQTRLAGSTVFAWHALIALSYTCAGYDKQRFPQHCSGSDTLGRLHSAYLVWPGVTVLQVHRIQSSILRFNLSVLTYLICLISSPIQGHGIRSFGRPCLYIPLGLRESLDHSVAAAPFSILRRFGFRARVSGDAPTLRRQRWCARAARPSPIVATTADCVPALSKQQPRPLKAAKPINLLPSSLTHDCAFFLTK